MTTNAKKSNVSVMIGLVH